MIFVISTSSEGRANSKLKSLQTWCQNGPITGTKWLENSFQQLGLKQRKELEADEDCGEARDNLLQLGPSGMPLWLSEGPLQERPPLEGCQGAPSLPMLQLQNIPPTGRQTTEDFIHRKPLHQWADVTASDEPDCSRQPAPEGFDYRRKLFRKRSTTSFVLPSRTAFIPKRAVEAT